MNSLIKKIGTYFFIVFFTIFIFLIILEVMNYMSALKITGYFVWEPGLKKVFLPDSSSFHGIYNESHFTINSLGYRGPLIMDKSKEYRILVIGGSTSECLYLDDSETWGNMMMNYLDKTIDGRKVIVMNVGKSGFNLRDHIIELNNLSEKYNPDMIIIMVGANDMLLKLSKRWVWKPFNESNYDYSRVFSSSGGYSWKSSVVYRLYKYFANGYNKIKPQDVNGNSLIEQRLERQNSGNIIKEIPDLNAPLEDYENNLKRIINVTREKNITLLFATQPYLWKENMTKEEDLSLWMTTDFNGNYYPIKTMIVSMNAFNRKLLEVCKKNKDVKCMDLDKSVPKTLDYFYDDMHFNEEGASLVAEKLSLYIKENFEDFFFITITFKI